MVSHQLALYYPGVAVAPPVTAFSSAFRMPLPAFSAAPATTEDPEPELEDELVPEGGGSLQMLSLVQALCLECFLQ